MIDWPYIVISLRKIFGSYRNIARNMKYNNPDYVARLGRDEIKDPPHSVGESLIDLYLKHAGDRVPRVGEKQQMRLIA
jgi:hypothetical protein